ncbi:MAG: hypothetical protein IJF06_00935 [Bacteroidaceae bacterium]|nr:hypothetical protein [Bacteroidaceae bacterium]
MTARERIQQEIEQWFLTEPVFFNVYCSHRLVMNANMLCPLRSGKGRIEYNPAIIETMTESQLRDLLRVEIIRILLQHPYARQPMGCPSIVLQKASDLVISPAYNLAWANLAHPTDFDLPTGQNYEWYAMRLNEFLDNLQQEGEQQQQESEQQQGEDSSSQGKNEAAEAGASNNSEQESEQQQGQDSSSQGKQQQESGQSEASSGNENSDNNNTPTSGYTDLWEEDQFQARQITDIVKSSSSWGSLPGGLIELIKKTAEGKIDYRAVLRMFRASILSQKRRLTRMRPSRRFGFEQMGSRYDFTTRLLIAIDTSGSVGSEDLGRYLNVITSFFKYGIQQIDVLMFDAKVQGKPLALTDAKKNIKELKVSGRGGTDFQAPVDYAVEHPEYDGLIIITDGFASCPDTERLRTKLLWVIDNESSYKNIYENLRKTGRVCLLER